MQNDEPATSGCLSDDLDEWAGSDTAYGWGVTVDPGFTDLEAKNADPVQLGSIPDLGVAPPADTHVSHMGVDCLYLGAYISTSTELSYRDAMHPSNPERDQWLLAMKDEMESFRAHGTWIVTPQPPNQRFLSGRWLFVKKIGINGLVERYKARFVVQDFCRGLGLTFMMSMPRSLLKLGLGFSLLPSLIGRCLFGSWISSLLFSMQPWNLVLTCTVTSLRVSRCLVPMAFPLCANLSSPFMV